MKHWLSACAIAFAAAANAVVPVVTAHAASATTGYDISWPQCPSNFPRGGAFGIVGVNDGIAWSQNPCLGAEETWAASRPGAAALYMNTADPGPQSSHWSLSGPNTSCDPTASDTSSASYIACAYNYGWNTAQNALGTQASAVTGAASQAWWLDVETMNTWAGSTAANAQDVQGSIDYLHRAGVVTVGVYSTAYQWQTITEGYAFPAATPEWLAGANSSRAAQNACAESPFGGSQSRIALTQYHSGGFDADVQC